MDSTQILRKIALVKSQCPEGPLREKLLKPLLADLEKAAQEDLDCMVKASEVSTPKK